MRAPARRRLFGLAMALILVVLGGEPAFASPNHADADPEPGILEPDPLFDDDFAGPSDPTRRDSIERFNRAMFRLNEAKSVG